MIPEDESNFLSLRTNLFLILFLYSKFEAANQGYRITIKRYVMKLWQLYEETEEEEIRNNTSLLIEI